MGFSWGEEELVRLLGKITPNETNCGLEQLVHASGLLFLILFIIQFQKYKIPLDIQESVSRE